MRTPKFDQAAELTVWPRLVPARTARRRDYATLREALNAAGEALATGKAQPWIITEGGDILTPNWIKAHTPLKRSRTLSSRRRSQ